MQVGRKRSERRRLLGYYSRSPQAQIYVQSADVLFDSTAAVPYLRGSSEPGRMHGQVDKQALDRVPVQHIRTARLELRVDSAIGYHADGMWRTIIELQSHAIVFFVSALEDGCI